jgi:hypothetical protein
VSESLSKEEKKQIAEEFYKFEEDRWKAASAAYFQPRGAPGRLSDGLLDAWHERNNTGIKHPQDLRRTLVKVMYDERSWSVKHFMTMHGAESYANTLKAYDIIAEVVEGDIASILGSF